MICLATALAKLIRTSPLDVKIAFERLATPPWDGITLVYVAQWHGVYLTPFVQKHFENRFDHMYSIHDGILVGDREGEVGHAVTKISETLYDGYRETGIYDGAYAELTDKVFYATCKTGRS